MMGADGKVGGRYDKQFLLMFGEYIPFGDDFPYLYEISPNSSAFGKGTSLDALVVGEHRLSATICYEDIIPGFFNDAVRHSKPDLLVNLTNDAWFGNTTEPWIHLALAKLRTVEHRLYMARATNSGISALVDATGAVVAHSSPFKQEVVYGEARVHEEQHRLPSRRRQIVVAGRRDHGGHQLRSAAAAQGRRRRQAIIGFASS